MTATASGTTGDAHAINCPYVGCYIKIVGGVCRATASGIRSYSLDAPSVYIEGGWVESDPKIEGYESQTKTHTGGALIEGDKGVVKKTAVIPEGMTATLRDGVTLTFEPDASLTVEPGATLDAGKGTLADAANKITNDGELDLPASMTKEQIKALGITGTGGIFKGTEPVRTDGTTDYDKKISAASQKFGESTPWTPASGDWEIVISMDSTVDIDVVSIDGEILTKDDEWSIKAASLGGISSKEEATRTVVISASALSALANETAASSHDLCITMDDGGYAEIAFWVGKMEEEDGPQVRSSTSGGSCDAGAAALFGLAALAMMKRRSR